MAKKVDADYLVVGAGAMGLAFTDALVDHADARVLVVDRRDGVGGHWRGAYSFVRLHQPSPFYGVASTPMSDAVQGDGPEAGLCNRASRAEVLAYYDDVRARLEGTGRVQVMTSTAYADRAVTGPDGRRLELPAHCRVVDARYLSPAIPAEVPPPFAVGDDVRVVPVNDVVGLDPDGPFVVVGSGKTATDAIVRLLTTGTAPDRVCWVRPREPWMFNRAVVQPDPALFLGASADLWENAVAADSVDDLLLRVEEAGVLLRFDRSVVPTMARVPILGEWELDLLRTVEHVVRRGHLRAVERGRLRFADGTDVRVADDAVVVHCAAHGLRTPPMVPQWGADQITLQTVRTGFPCFGAALTGYVEATRTDDAEKNRLCPPNHYGDTPADWVEMNVIGTRNAAAFSAEPDVKAWADGVALNPARIPPGAGSPALDRVLERIAEHAGPGTARAAELVRLARG
ncbi:hypothetical protein F4692_001120 [Nocardioides cavernae]|uniref:Pyridine nucleotide-disulfide oxidoreductase n=1 Tax=Nocardioides cavernae TaxID=1921566 RepID=A0A7Y9H1N9_9ACTN|nr:NAD(P)-binding protein [Nocardioides cavernae]NYE36016.1 hypothetical protein [Nocardioides cavernae]